METIADITISQSEFNTDRIVIDQDDDRIVVEPRDIEEFAAAVRKHVPTIEESEPENVMTQEDLRMVRIVARVRINQLRRDVAYEEGKINMVESLLEE